MTHSNSQFSSLSTHAPGHVPPVPYRLIRFRYLNLPLQSGRKRERSRIHVGTYKKEKVEKKINGPKRPIRGSKCSITRRSRRRSNCRDVMGRPSLEADAHASTYTQRLKNTSAWCVWNARSRRCIGLAWPRIRETFFSFLRFLPFPIRDLAPGLHATRFATDSDGSVRQPVRTPGRARGTYEGEAPCRVHRGLHSNFAWRE